MYQYIHLISNTTSPTPLDVWAPGGPHLKPQYADQIALGYVSDLPIKDYDMVIETYYKQLNNTTDFIDGADLLFTEAIETQVVQGEGRAYGLEVQVSKNAGPLTGWIAYTLSQAETKAQGINSSEYYPVNSNQIHELSIVGLYKISKRWELNAAWIYGSGRPVTYPSGKYTQNGLVVPDFSVRNSNRLPAYHRLDVSAILHPKPDSKRKGKWIFSVANAYNRYNASSIFFREKNEVNGQEVATGLTQATKLSYYGIVPAVSYQFSF